MADDLVLPRLLYRGFPDVLGKGTHVNENGDLVGETKRVNTPDELETALAAGWRLTSAIAAPAPGADLSPAAEPSTDDAPKSKGKK